MCWQCDHPGGDYYGEVVLPAIACFGWMVQWVEPTRVHAELAYTVGLTDHGLPELVVTGLAGQPAAQLLDAAGNLLHERPAKEGDRWTVGGRQLELVHVPEPSAHLLTAATLYGPRLRAFQLVHADDGGVWPWHRGHRAGKGGQPVLGPRAVRRTREGRRR